MKPVGRVEQEQKGMNAGHRKAGCGVRGERHVESLLERHRIEHCRHRIAMNRGQRRPNSNESTVPDTAPTAKRMAVPLAQRLARSRWIGSPVFCQRRSAMTINTGMPMPTTAKMMWKPRETAICDRAARRSGMREGMPELNLFK